MSDQQQCLASRLADVRVSMRTDLTFTRQTNRDGVSYIVHHPVTFQNHRLSAEDYLVLSQMRTSRTLKDVFTRLIAQNLLAADQEEEFYRFVVHLNQLQLLRLPISDGAQLHAKFVENKRKHRAQTAKSFLFLRIPLFEPMSFLDRTLVFARPMFSKTALCVWVAAMAFCISLVIHRWNQFSDPLGTMLATSNFLVLWGLLLGLKVVHEFGHAYACRVYGAKVPEMGAFFLMGSPCAYMDASDSWNLTSRRERLTVAMGGMYFESWLAMAGVLIWSMTEPSLLNSIAQYTVVLSTVITIGFNINPLMKYDGYYALSDLLGRPLLREDARFEFMRLVKRVLFGLHVETQTETTFERTWLIVFGLACSVYRLLIAISIATVLGMFIPVLGSLVLVAYVGSTLIKLAKNGLVYLRTSPEVAECRTRAWVASGMALAALVTATLLVPVPGNMRAQGVVVPETQMVAYATSPGFLAHSEISNGASVATGAVLCRLTNPDVERAVVEGEAAVRDLELQLTGQLTAADRASVVTQQRLRQARQSLAEAIRTKERLTILAPVQGVVSGAEGLRLHGRYVRAGEPIAQVGSGKWLVSSLVDEETFSDLHPDIGDDVKLTVVATRDAALSGRIVEIRRMASERIEQPQLTQLGGGDVPVTQELIAQKPYIELRIEIDSRGEQLKHGQRALVRFGTVGSSLATVGVRGLHRLFNQMR